MTKEKNIISKTFTGVCCNDPSHEFPVVVDVVEGTDEVVSKLEVFCPDCGEMTQFEIKGELAPDANVLKFFIRKK